MFVIRLQETPRYFLYYRFKNHEQGSQMFNNYTPWDNFQSAALFESVALADERVEQMRRDERYGRPGTEYLVCNVFDVGRELYVTSLRDSYSSLGYDTAALDRAIERVGIRYPSYRLSTRTIVESPTERLEGIKEWVNDPIKKPRALEAVLYPSAWVQAINAAIETVTED